MPHRYFQLLLQFLVAMGAGTLLATGILVLIPEVRLVFGVLTFLHCI